MHHSVYIEPHPAFRYCWQHRDPAFGFHNGMQYIIVYPGNGDSPDTQSAKVQPDTGAGKYASQRLKTRLASCVGLANLALCRE